MPQVRCKICRKEFYAKPNHLKLGWGKYCSNKCRSRGSRKGKYVICEICGKEAWKMPKDLRGSKSGKFFCGKSCQTKWRNVKYSGPNHPLWRGGEFTYYRIMKESKIPSKCKLCGQEDKRALIIHHKDCNRKNYNINNLAWLCRNCHYLVHNYGEKI